MGIFTIEELRYKTELELDYFETSIVLYREEDCFALEMREAGESLYMKLLSDQLKELQNKISDLLGETKDA